MTEWLTENSRRAYPLDKAWPASFHPAFGRVLLDACVGCSGEPDSRLELLGVRKSGDGLMLHIGRLKHRNDRVDVLIPPETGRVTAFAGNDYVKAIVTADADSARAAADSLGDELWHPLHLPFSLRCTSYANRFVSSVEAFSPDYPCARPVFSPETEHMVAKLTGDIVLRVKNGLDLEVTTMAPLTGDLLRVTPVTAPMSANANDKPLDMMIRGDDCISVESLPGHAVDGGAVVPVSDLSSGVIRITEKCKPCCQCEDYINAFEALKPGNDGVYGINELMDKAKKEYEDAVELFNTVKGLARDRINDYDHVTVYAAAVSSGGVSTDVSAEGLRSRIAVSLTVMNLALEDAKVSGVSVYVNGYSHLKSRWWTSGHSPSAGTSVDGRTWTLKPGDSLYAVVTVAASTTTNKADIPSDIGVTLTRKLRSREQFTTTVPVL